MRTLPLFVAYILCFQVVAETKYSSPAGRLAKAVEESSQAVGKTEPDNKTWAREHLREVYRTTGFDPMEPEDKILMEAGLLSDDEMKEVIKTFQKKHETDQEPKRSLPDDLGERVLAAFRKIHERGLVLAEHGSVRPPLGKSRYGVMTKAEYEKMFGKKAGSNLVSYRCNMSHGGEKIEIDCDFLDALDYVSFGCKYDSTAKRWVNRYPPESSEHALINATQRAIAKIYVVDIYFDQGAELRKHLAGEFQRLRVERRDAQNLVEEEITLWNLRRFRETYADHEDLNRLLPARPTDKELLDFNSKYGRKLRMTLGHMAPDEK